MQPCIDNITLTTKACSQNFTQGPVISNLAAGTYACCDPGQAACNNYCSSLQLKHNLCKAHTITWQFSNHRKLVDVLSTNQGVQKAMRADTKLPAACSMVC